MTMKHLSFFCHRISAPCPRLSAPRFPSQRRRIPLRRGGLWAALGGLSALLLPGCGPKPAQGEMVTAPGSGTVVAAASSVRFDEVGEASGIRYEWKVAGTRPLNILQTIGNGCAFLDYDNDGNLDILLVGPHLALYKGDGKGHFTDVTHDTGLDTLSGHFLGCAVGDYDNDGYDDVYISGYRTGILLHNEGGKRFSDATRQAGLTPQPWGTSCGWAETVPGSGKLDLFVANYADFGPDPKKYLQLCPFDKIMSSCGPRYYKPIKGALFANLGGGKFAEVAKARGLATLHGRGLGVAWADYEGSGVPGLAVSNDEIDGDLMKPKGRGPNLRYENVGNASGTAVDRDGNIHGGMGTDWGDYDNDGKLDLAVATFQRENKCVYHNDGAGLFTEKSSALGLAGATAPWVAFGTKFADVDNDGLLDLFFANGHVQDNIDAIEKSATYRQKTQLFHNIGGAQFEELGAKAGPAFDKEIVGRGLAVGDYDNDGKMDALVVDSEGKPLLLHNVSANTNHWLICRLKGTKSNRDGIGAQVTFDVGGKKMLRQCATDGSYLSASDRRVHCGLGAVTTVTVSVRWPSGKTDTYPNLSADRVVTLVEGSPKPR